MKAAFQKALLGILVRVAVVMPVLCTPRLASAALPDVPVVVVKTPDEAESLLLPAAMLLDDRAGKGGAAGAVSLIARVEGKDCPERLSEGTRFVRLSPDLTESEAENLVGTLREKWPDITPILPVLRPFGVQRPPTGTLIESPVSDSGPGWLVYRHYMVATRKARFLVARLSDDQIVLGAAAGGLEKDGLDADTQRNLARLYALVWLGGGFSRPGEGGALLLMPPGSSISDESLQLLDGFHRAVLEAGIPCRILLADDISPADVFRYGLIAVPDVAALSDGLQRALVGAAGRGSIVVVMGMGQGPLAEAAGVVRDGAESRLVKRFERTDPPMPQVGADGLSRYDRRLKASADCQVLLGGHDTPVITLKRVDAGYVLVLNVDFAAYGRMSELGLSGARQLTEVLRWAQGRAGLDCLGGVEGKGERGLLGLMGPVPVGVVNASWYRLAFFLKGGGENTERALLGPSEREVPMRVYEGDAALVDGVFSRRVEWLTAKAERTDSGGGVTLDIRSGGLPEGAALPVMIEPMGHSGIRFVPALCSGRVEIQSLRATGRLLVRDLLFSFRALAAY